MIDRKEIYKIIDEERDYQESFVKDKFSNPNYPHNTTAELLMLKVYIDRALVEWVDNKGDDKALDMIRKIAAISVRCMENNGAVSRNNKNIEI